MSEITRNDLGQAGVSACEEKGVKVYAVTTSIDGADRGGSAAVAGEQFHTDGGVYQVAVECGGGDRHGFVAAECFWSLSFFLPHAHQVVSKPESTARRQCANHFSEMAFAGDKRQTRRAIGAGIRGHGGKTHETNWHHHCSSVLFAIGQYDSLLRTAGATGTNQTSEGRTEGEARGKETSSETREAAGRTKGQALGKTARNHETRRTG